VVGEQSCIIAQVIWLSATMNKTESSLRFICGWRLALHRGIFLLRAIKYLVARRRYPLFRLRAASGGLLATYKISRALYLRKQVRFKGAYFSSLLSPHYPSPAFDCMVARGGLNGGAAGTPLRQQMDTVILAMTRQCGLHCQHCYERHNINGDDRVSISRWQEIISQIQHMGTSIIVLSGGEPLARYDGLLELLRTANKDLSDFHLHTSGWGVTPERARELRNAGLTAAAVGLDDVDPLRHDALRGSAGAHDEAIAALRIFHEAGVLTYVNLCLQQDMIRAGDLWRYYDLVKELKVAFVQMLEPRPCGAYLTTDGDVMLTAEDQARATEFFITANTQRHYRNYPAVHYVAYAESPQQQGCRMAGLSHLYIDSLGNVNPCVFLPVTFGSILHEDFPAIHARMRKIVAHPIYRECPSLTLAETLRAQTQAGQCAPVPFEQIKTRWEELLVDSEI
jgi:MoaA/NifB/PqqE/SkfB family radical SAM enzyme